jgi:cobalt/nickel transport system permease protein
VVYAARRAQRELDESQVPLMGVLGAFVFAAQMVNFPLGAGTSGHLLGATLLAALLGPAPAIVVLTAILVLQALIFQDGGLLALGANVFNMAIAATLAGYFPWRALAAGRARRFGLFVGGFCSVLVCACLCLGELSFSGIHFGRTALTVILVAFTANALLEGALTVAVAGALDSVRPGWLKAPAEARRPALGLILALALVLASVGFLFASTQPDAVQHLAQITGLAAREHALFKAPLGDYELKLNAAEWVRKPAVGLLGVALAAGLCLALARGLRARRSA